MDNLVESNEQERDKGRPPRRGPAQKYTDALYRTALVELEPIFGAKKGTPDGDRALALFDAIEAYEAVHYPMDKPSPQAVAEYECDKSGRHLT